MTQFVVVNITSKQSPFKAQSCNEWNEKETKGQVDLHNHNNVCYTNVRVEGKQK